MKVLLIAMLAGALALCGCVSSSPITGMEKGSVYSLNEFEEALLEEKSRILEAELRRVRYFGLSEKREVELTPSFVAEYPLLADWMQARSVAVEGDEVWEYRNRNYERSDGTGQSAKRGYALVRQGRVIVFMPLNPSWCIEY